MEDAVWGRIDVSRWEVDGEEQSGSSEATWLRDPDTDDLWLHKSTKIPGSGPEQGEDWSEVVSTQVARQLSIPCARTRLCSRDDRRGSLSLCITPPHFDLWEGAVVLEGAPGFYRQIEGGPRARDPLRPNVHRPGHNLVNIKNALQGVSPPPGFAGPETVTGFDVFAGYTVLDALIANSDRHEQNWAKLRPRLRGRAEMLAPSYDHASSLGQNLTDDARRQRLSHESELAIFARKGLAGRFEHVKPAPTLVDNAATAVRMCSDEGAHWLRQQLYNVDLTPVLDAVSDGKVPEMSEVASKFACKLLTLNLRRLCDAIGNSS